MHKKRIFGALATVFVLAFWSAPAASAAEWHHGRDSGETGCASGSYVIANWPLVNQKYNEVQGHIQVMYSPACSTNWINLYGNVAGNKYEAGISLYSVPGGAMQARVDGIGTDYSHMVYAPGSTCVYVGAAITDIASGGVEMSTSRSYC